MRRAAERSPVVVIPANWRAAHCRQYGETELDRVHTRIADRFTRSEPRGRAQEYLSGLVTGLERKNGWTLAPTVMSGGPRN